MLLAIPLVLCIFYMKNDKYTMVKYNTIQKQCPAYCKCQNCGLTSAGRGHKFKYMHDVHTAQQMPGLVDQWSSLSRRHKSTIKVQTGHQITEHTKKKSQHCHNQSWCKPHLSQHMEQQSQCNKSCIIKSAKKRQYGPATPIN